jgi:hypothetical protein
MHIKGRIGFLGLAAAVTLSFFWAIPLRADRVVVGLTFFPDPVVVQEFAPGAVKITISNNNNFPVQIACIDNVNCKDKGPTPTILYDSGDRNDQAFNPVDDVTNCTAQNGKYLELGASGGSCNYKINFDTRDLNVPASGKNFGKWALISMVGFSYQQNNVVSLVYTSGEGIIYVTDPGSPSPVPEPNVLLLWVGGIGAVATRLKRSR